MNKEKKAEKTVKPNAFSILVIEDSMLEAKALQSILIYLHCNDDIAENRMLAIKIVPNNHYNLIFLDIRLPDIGGI